ncbi:MULTISPECIES: hypothetical protein [Rahnella]|uniref:hypothetical protein n=1 Tax=Rahnella TaxID=34037 RepID=UPI001E561549|nr:MULTISPECIES: hypothetical protein [Rahnella]
MTSRPQMIINVLQANPGKQFSARQLAQKSSKHMLMSWLKNEKIHVLPVMRIS